MHVVKSSIFMLLIPFTGARDKFYVEVNENMSFIKSCLIFNEILSA